MVFLFGYKSLLRLYNLLKTMINKSFWVEHDVTNQVIPKREGRVGLVGSFEIYDAIFLYNNFETLHLDDYFGRISHYVVGRYIQ